MRTQASRTLFWMFVLGCMLFVPPAAMATDPEPVETTFTNGEGVDADGDGIVDPPPADQIYCVYTIGRILQGNCGQFTTGDRLCIDCPAAGKCPSPANTITRFRYVDAFGQVICRGEWSRSFDVTKPDACITCSKGKTGYKFL